MSAVSVSSLSIYPLKSTREINLAHSEVEAFGLKNDRRWMVVDDQGVMLTQRKLPGLCLIQPVLTEYGLRLSYTDKTSIEVIIPDSCLKRQVKIWDDLCHAYDAGDQVALWLENKLGTSCRLVYFPQDEFRQVDLNYANPGDKTAFSDGFPLLLISQASLDDLNQRLNKPVAMNRFRPNIVVQGCEPFAEDGWRKIRIGKIIYRIVKPCSRCVIPSINIETAEKEDGLLETLAGFRRHNNKVFFGQNVIAETTGFIENGMIVEVIE